MVRSPGLEACEWHLFMFYLHFHRPHALMIMERLTTGSPLLMEQMLFTGIRLVKCLGFDP